MLQKRLEVVSNSNRRWFVRIEVTQQEEEEEEEEQLGEERRRHGTLSSGSQ